MEQKRIDQIKEALRTKASVKQDVFALTKEVFVDLKDVVKTVTRELHDFARDIDQRVAIEVKETGSYEVQLTLAGDTLIFLMHTNVFGFPDPHIIHKNSYVSKEPLNAYCGIINIYNFLTDSYRYQRLNDSGYLVGRIFVNRERHFFVEGRGRLGFLFNDFANAQLNPSAIRDVVETALQYAIDFDLFTPPFQAVREVTLGDMQELSQAQMLKTGKRLGFRFEADNDDTIF